MNKIVIGIDGPVGSGKGTLSVALARRLNILYLYTGGMYRSLALACLNSGANLDDQEEVLAVLKDVKIDPEVNAGETRMFLDGQDVTDKIIEPEISNATPHIARHPKVREEMVRRQKALIEGKSAVIEGRDIASKVAPNADLKIHLTASVEARAKRRLMQYEEKGISKNFDQVLEETRERDRKDMEREASPLEVSSDSVMVDTTNDTIEDTVNKVLSILREKGLYD